MHLHFYNTVRHKMRTGDLILWSSNTILGWLIQKFTKSDVNHASLVIKFNQYDKERVYVLEALAGGVVLRALSERLENHKGRARWYGTKPEFSNLTTHVGAMALMKVGTKYDYKSLFKQAFSRVSADARAFFCSEYWWWCWKMCGISFVSDIAPRPGDLSDCTILTGGINL